MFSHLYPSVPILVTSRDAGYEQAPLDEEQFEVFNLLPFDNEQVQEFVEKWFSAGGEEDIIFSHDRTTKSFFDMITEITFDHRTNPLLLSLLYSIYPGEKYIPRSRLDIYEKAATLLFEQWDKNRAITPLPRSKEQPSTLRLK